MDNNIAVTEDVKKKRGRKKKIVEVVNDNQSPDINITISIVENENEPEVTPVAKKRGRKPKGGKLILKQTDTIDEIQPITNVILHLKCCMQDLNEHNSVIQKLVTDPMTYNPTVPPSIMTYNSNEATVFSNFINDNLANQTNEPPNLAYTEFAGGKQTGQTLCHACNTKIESTNNVDTIEEEDDDVNMKDINLKLKKIKLQLYKNINPDKKSACFWCTYDYDNQTCYIPKYEIDNQLYGYGSFCRPECAVAYLMKENIDDSTKFERYHLLNQIYSKVYEYKKNIKPAPNPYFLLNKFYGNLSIQEYRKLLKTEHMLLVIEKPMTRILPELHEDNEDFIMNIYGTKHTQSNQTGFYKVKRQSEKQKGPSKSSIMKENFGIA